MIVKTISKRLVDGLTGYVVALRISAAAAMPESFRVEDLQSPAPIIRTDPSHRMAGDFDPRELISGGGNLVHVLVVEQTVPIPSDRSETSSFHLN